MSNGINYEYECSRFHDVLIDMQANQAMVFTSTSRSDRQIAEGREGCTALLQDARSRSSKAC